MKIIDKINQKIDEGTTFYSFEYFPPKTEEGVKNLHDRQKYMSSLDPLFCDITWGAGGSTADLTLTIAEKMQAEVRVVNRACWMSKFDSNRFICSCRLRWRQ